MPRGKKLAADDPLFAPEAGLFDPPDRHCLFGLTLRSQAAHGEILAVTHPPLPDDVILVLAEDIPGQPHFSSGKGRMPILASDTVRYKGEPCGLLAGPDPEELRQIASAVRFVLRKKPLGQAWESEPGPKARLVSKGIAPEDRSVIWVEGTYTTGSQDGALSSALAVCAWEKDGVVYLNAPTQWPAHAIQSVAKMLVWDPAKIQILSKPSSAHADGQLWYPALAACHAALLANLTKKPVRVVYSKDEEFYFSPKRPESRFHLRTALTSEGRIAYMEAEMSLNMGAYALWGMEFVDRAVIGLLGLYKMDAWKITARADLSHTPPRGPVSGLGEALGQLVMEAHVLDLAREVSQNPADWKLANLHNKEESPFGGPIRKEESALPLLAREILKKTDFGRKYAAYDLLLKKRKDFADEILPQRGVGLSLGFQGNGFLDAETAPASLEIRLETTGKLSIFCGLIPSNPRLLARWRKLASEILQIPERDVLFCKVHSGALTDTGPSIASRALEMGERLIVQCCEAIVQKRFRQGLPITIKRPFRRAKNLSWDEDRFTGIPFQSFSWGACAVELEINPVHSQLAVKKATLIVEAGEIGDEEAARTALRQSLQIGMGWALLENIGWENQSIPRSVFLKYRIPSLTDLPWIDIHFLRVDRPSAPKGLGDLGVQLMAGALLSAFHQALGYPLRSIPITRKFIDEALRSYEN